MATDCIRPPPRPDPIPFKASPVEKQRAPPKARHEFPAWFYRVAGIEFTKNRDIRPFDYDEDLSDLEETAKSDKGRDKHGVDECECDSDVSECDCHLEEDDDTTDDESERSYAGSLAEYYYELKDEREERKRELLKQRRTSEKEREKQMKFERRKEDEVNAAYESFKKARRRARKKGEKIPIDSIENQKFELFSSDYVGECISEFGDTHFAKKRADFYYVHESDWGCPITVVGAGLENVGKGVGGQEEPMYLEGQVYLDHEANCAFGPVRIPTYARRKNVKFKSHDGRYDLWFKFFGNGYLKLSVSRDFVFNSGGTDSSSVAIVNFVGILRDLEGKERDGGRKGEESQEAPSFTSGIMV